MIGGIGRKSDKEKAVRLTLWDREDLWLRVVARITGRKHWSSGEPRLYPRQLDGIEPFHFESGPMLPPCKRFEFYPKRINQGDFERLEKFLREDDPFSAMARSLCYQVAEKVKEYRDQITEEVVIPRDWEGKASALYVRLKRGGGLTQFEAAEKLGMEEQRFRRREKAISTFYLWLRERVRRQSL